MNNDSASVAAVLNGETRAFEGLVQKYQHSLYGFVRSRIADENAAEDVAQDVFLAAYKNLASLDDSRRFAAWLFGIARRKVLLYYRSKGRRHEETGAEFDHVPAPPIHSQRDGLLDSLLDGLPDDMRTVLLLRVRDDLSYREIAQSLGMPVGTVGTLIHRARSLAFANYKKWSGEPL